MHSLFLPRRLPALAAAAALPVLLAGCSALGLDDGATDDGSTRVVASFYPLEYVAGRVAGEHADVVGLTSPGAEPHDLELTIRQVAGLEEADVVAYAEEIQPAVDDAVDQAGPEHVVEARAAAAEQTDDLHFWLDPLALAEVGEAVAARLAEADPEHAADYEANAEALAEDLTALDAELTQGLASCERSTVVVSHDAFGALGRYGLDFAPISGLSPDAEPSPAQLRELAGLIEDEGVTTVFSETLVSPELAETLAGDLGLRTDVLDPIEGLAEETAGEDYLSLMRGNLEALREANGCR